MLIRINVRDTTVVALEMQAARRDHAVQGLQRCTRPTAPGRAGLRLDVGARHFTLVFGGMTVATKWCPRELHPGGRVGRLSRTGWGHGSGDEATGPEQRHAVREKEPTVEQPMLGCRLSGKRVLHGASAFRHVVPPTA